jgi:hypothetical protein
MMKAKKLLGAMLSIGLALGTVGVASDVLAQGKAKTKKEADPPPPPPDPPVVKKAISEPFPGVTWGLNPAKLGDVVDKVIDEDYKPTYKDTSPGVKMKALDAQVAEDKAQFRRSRVDFGKTPTGLDGTALKGEYTYLNKEAVLSITRKGETTYFFFIQEKLWKVIVEKKLAEGTPLGKNFQEAVTKLSTNYGVAGRIMNPDATRSSLEVDWKDSGTHLRAIQRSDTLVALAYEDLGIAGSIASMRTNKPVVDDGIDPAVAAAMRKPSNDPGPPPDKSQDKKKKK